MSLNDSGSTVSASVGFVLTLLRIVLFAVGAQHDDIDPEAREGPEELPPSELRDVQKTTAAGRVRSPARLPLPTLRPGPNPTPPTPRRGAGGGRKTGHWGQYYVIC